MPPATTAATLAAVLLSTVALSTATDADGTFFLLYLRGDIVFRMQVKPQHSKRLLRFNLK